MINDIDEIDVIGVGFSRHGHQYSDSIKYRAFLKATLEPIVELQTLLFKLIDIDLVTAKGIKLDLIGRIIGAPAVIPNAIPQPFFGFDNQELAMEFGEIGEPDDGGYWREIYQPSNIDLILRPDDYRKIVDAQIIKNKSACNPDDIIKVVQTISGDELDFKYVEYPMGIVIAPLDYMNFTDRQILTAMIPRPAGVSFAVLNNHFDSTSLNSEEQIMLYDEHTY